MTPRCEAAHCDDPRPCSGRGDLVLVVDRHGGSCAGCVRHAAQLVAAVSEARVYPFAGDDGHVIAVLRLAGTRTPGDYRD